MYFSHVFWFSSILSCFHHVRSFAVNLDCSWSLPRFPSHFLLPNVEAVFTFVFQILSFLFTPTMNPFHQASRATSDFNRGSLVHFS